jgi:hypothetical protein
MRISRNLSFDYEHLISDKIDDYSLVLNLDLIEKIKRSKNKYATPKARPLMIAFGSFAKYVKAP